MKKYLLLFCSVVIVFPSVFAQTTFRKVYPSPIDQSGLRILPATGTSYLVVCGDPYFTQDSRLMKIDKNGQILSTVPIRTPGNLAFNFSDIISTADSGFLLCGTVVDAIHDDIMIVIKTDSAGDTLWTKQFPLPVAGGYINQGKCILALSDGNFLMAGIQEDSDYYQILLIRKLDPSGNVIWTNSINTGHEFTGHVKVVETTGQSLMFYLYKTFGGPSVPGGRVLLTDSLGNLQWTGSGYAPPGYGTQMISQGGGKYLLSGFTKDYWDDDLVHNYIFNYDTSGSLSNPIRYDLSAPVNSMVQSPDSGYVLALGFYYFNAPVDHLFELWKTDSAGVLIWQNSFPVNSKEMASDIIRAHDGGLIAVGTTESGGVQKVYIVKTDDNGIIHSGNYSITASGPPCAGDTLYLSVPNAASYLWSNGATTQTIPVTANGFYGLEITDSLGNLYTPSWYHAEFNQPPVVSLGNDTVLCSGSILTLDAGAGFMEYLWQDGSENQQLIIASAIADTVYAAVMVTDANGCTATDSTTVFFQVCSFTSESETPPVFVIYPNPAKGFLSVMASRDEAFRGVSFYIYDLTGRKIFQKELQAKLEKADLRHVSKGIYQYRFASKEGVVKSGKLVLE